MSKRDSQNKNESSSFEELAGKYLTFALRNEVYGVQILNVQEIIGIMPVNPVPGYPVYVKGVINLRGKLIPVVDLRLKLGMSEKEPDERTCIIVVTSHLLDETIYVGLVVDNVREVYEFRGDHIEQAPRLTAEGVSGPIIGMGKIDEVVVTFLDIDRCISDEIQVIASTTSSLNQEGEISNCDGLLEAESTLE